MSSSLKQQDDFMWAVGQFFSGLSHHVRAFVGVVVIAVVGGAIGAYVVNHNDERSEKAASALFAARQAYETELKPLTEAKADAKNIEYRKLEVDAKFPETLQKLKSVAELFPNTRAGFEALEQLGDLYYTHGEASQAVTWYRKAVSFAPHSLDHALALSSLGYALENSGQLNEALSTYQKALDLGEGALKGDLLMASARCYALLHDAAKARATYDQVISQLGETDYAKSAEQAKALLQ